MISNAGQFKLTRIDATTTRIDATTTRLEGTTTRLEGTTWSYHRLWPSFFWGAISDAIIHKIHLKVLNHIKTQVERS